MHDNGNVMAECIDGIAGSSRKTDGKMDKSRIDDIAKRLWGALSSIGKRVGIPVVLQVDYQGKEKSSEFRNNKSPDEVEEIKNKSIVVDSTGKVRPFADKDKYLTGSLEHLGDWFYRELHKDPKDFGSKLYVYKDGIIEIVAEDAANYRESDQEEFMQRIIQWHALEEGINNFLLSHGEFSQVVMVMACDGEKKLVGYGDNAPLEEFEKLDTEFSSIC